MIQRKVALLCVLLCIVLAGCSSFESNLKGVGDLDQKYGLSMNDYINGLAYLKDNPRYPDPMNVGEIDGIAAEYSALLSNFTEGTPEYLFLDARIDLLMSEKFYKLATKTKKGLTAYGFACNDFIYVEAADHNFGVSIEYGLNATEKLYSLADKFPDEAESLNITKFGVKFLENTYHQMDEDTVKNMKRIVDMCNMTVPAQMA